MGVEPLTLLKEAHVRDSYRTLRVVFTTAICVAVIGISGCGDDDKPNTSDTTPPTVESTTPADAATLVSISSSVTAEFSEDMDSSSISTSTFTLMQGATAVPGVVTYSTNPGATFNPNADLLPNTVYTATITTGAEDLAGNGLASDYVWSFTTGPAPDVTPPTVVSTAPPNGAVDVSVNGVVTATFSEPLSPTSISKTSFLLIHNFAPVDGDVVYSGNTATFTPLAPFDEDGEYTATITTAVTDLSGNPLAADYSWGFTTETSDDVTAPTVLSKSPAHLATGVSVSGNITANFSETMALLTITTTTFTLTQGVTPVLGAVSYNGTTATFDPNANLAFNTVYTATLTVGATDLAGNPLAAPVVWAFTTAASPDVTPPTVVTVSPASGALDVAVGGNITATFSEPMNSATIGSSFMLMQGAVHITGVVSYAGNTLTFNPSADLAGGATFTATIFTTAEDLASNNLAADFVWSFITEVPPDATPPTVTSTVPTNGALGIAIGANLTATFSEAMDVSTITTATFTVTGGTSAVTGVVTYAGTTATFNPDVDLDSSTVYTATITTGVEDEAGNHLAANKVWTFTTGDPGDVTPPTVTAVTPMNQTINNSTMTNITVTFSEPMDPLTINSSTFTITDGTNQITGDITYAGLTATFNPHVKLDTIKVYSPRVTTGATDVAGNPLAADEAWIFTTERSPSVTETVPATGNPNIPVTAKVAAQFNRPIAGSSFTTSTFILQQGGVDVAGTVSASGTSAVFDPAGDLLPNTVYTATITSQITDVSGNRMTADKVWSFTTGSNSDVDAPTISETDPDDAETGVARGKTIRVFFTDAMDLSTLNNATFTVKLNGVAHAGTVTYAGTIGSFAPTTQFEPNSVYTATVTTTVADISGNQLAVEKVWTFTTGP